MTPTPKPDSFARHTHGKFRGRKDLTVRRRAFHDVAREALGLVETRGWVAAVEAADAMCKTARVRLTRYEVTRAALVTVIVRGPLAEVEAAVAAGAAAASRLGQVLAGHVIPAPEPQLEEPFGGPTA